MRPVFVVFEKLLRWTAYLGVVSLSIAMFATVADVVLRAITRTGNLFMDSPIGLAVPGVVDLVQLFVMAAVFMSIPFAFMGDAHVSVDLLTARLDCKREAFFKGVGALLSSAFMIAVLYYGWGQARIQMEFGDSSSTLEIPMIWFWCFLLFGAGLSVVATVLLTIRHFLMCIGMMPTAPETVQIAQGE